MFRWLSLAILLSALALSGYHRYRARLNGEVIPRGREGSLLLVLRGIMGVALFGGILVQALKPEWMTWATMPLPEPLRWLGLALGVIAVAAIQWVLSTLGRNVTETVLTKEGHQLVTHGPYRWVRHPLYTTGLVLFVALSMMLGSWFVLLAAAIAFVLLRLGVIPREERALLAKFGEQYQTYMSRTGQLVPQLGAGRWSFQRVLILLEVVLGAIVTLGGIALVTIGVVTGHHDRHHGGAYVVLGGSVLTIMGLGILLPGLALRMRHPAKWALQLIPLAGLIYWLST